MTDDKKDEQKALNFFLAPPVGSRAVLLGDMTFDRFMAALDPPGQPNTRLNDLISSTSRWDRDQ